MEGIIESCLVTHGSCRRGNTAKGSRQVEMGFINRVKAENAAGRVSVRNRSARKAAIVAVA